MTQSKPRTRVSSRSLARVADPQGRMDVLLYELANRGMEKFEREQNILGLRENLLPIIEQLIVRHIPPQNCFSEELAALLRICQQNRRAPNDL